MKAHFGLFLVMFSSFILRGQYENTTFPYIKENGSWELIRGKKHVQLPENIFEVSTFDNTGKAFFYATTGSGLLDTTGSIIYQSSSLQIIQLTNGAYIFKENEQNHLFRLDKKIDLYCSDFDKITDDWFFYKQDTNWYFSNTNWKEGLPFNSANENITYADNELIIIDLNDSIRSMYAANGNLLYTGEIIFMDFGYGIYIQCEKLHILRDQYGTLELPLRSSTPTFYGDFLNYTVGNVSYYMERKTRKIVFSFTCTEIETMGNYYKCFRNNRCIIATKSGVVKVPALYNDIWETSLIEGGYQAGLNGVYCLLDSNFKEVTPCKFINFQAKDNLLLCRTEMGTIGVISQLTKKELLPPIYRYIRLLNHEVIKGWENDRMTYLELTSDHKIKNRFVVDNVVSINQTKHGDFEYDQRLLDQGWFFDFDTVRNQYGQYDMKNLKWGLRKNDSILYGLKKYTPLYIPEVDFNLIESEKGKFNMTCNLVPYGMTRQTDLNFFSVINHNNGLMNCNRKIVYLDSIDCKNRTYMRYFATDGAGIIFRDGSIKKYAFVDVNINGISRVCNAPALMACEKFNPEGINLAKFISDGYYFGDNYLMLDGKWNYINPAGDPIYTTDFDYVEPFRFGTAIYRMGNHYGIINKDSMLISANYTKMERLSKFKDTLFMVQQTKNKVQFFTAYHQKLSSEVGSARRILHYTVVPKKTGFALWNAHGEEVLDDFNSVKLTEYNQLLFRSKKEYILRDTNLEIIGRFQAKPIEFIATDLFIFGDNKVGICSIQGDTILPIEYHTITSSGNFIVAIKPSESVVFDKSFQVVKKIKEGQICIDSVRNQLFTWDNNQLTAYTPEGNKCLSVRLNSTPLYVHNGVAFLKNGNILSLYNSTKSNYLPTTYRHFEVFQGGYISIHETSGKWSLFNREGNPIAAIQHVSHIEQIDLFVFHFSHTDNEYLIDIRSPEHLVRIKKVIGKFEGGLLLVKDEKGYHYLNRKLEDEFTITFEDAEPFGELYACVKLRGGWSIMNRKGWMTCTIENNRIAQRGHSIFETQTQPVYGLIDSHGNTILPVKYERITFINNQLIQVREGGKIGYYTIKGEKLLN